MTIQTLTKPLAEKYLAELTVLMQHIPETQYTEKDVLAERKDDRIFHAKWVHSFIAVDDAGKPIGLAMGYERAAEGNDQYPENTMYLAALAVDEAFQNQGIGRKLVEHFINVNTRIGFTVLSGQINFSVQTNNAEWNAAVQRFYGRFGFTKRAIKLYPHKGNYVYGYTPEVVTAA